MNSSDTNMRIGVDLGGTKIEAAALAANGVVVERMRTSTPDAYDAAIRAVAGLVERLEARIGAISRIGVGIPGSVNPETGLVRNANSTWLNTRPFPTDLAQATRRQVRVANDADCFALSEAIDGAGEGAGIVFGVILGTGVGGGVVINATPLAGAQGIAGEWGHNPLPAPRDDEHPGPRCWCGKLGCLETWLSGPGLAAEFQRRCGRSLSPRAIADAAREGDNEAKQALMRYADRLARGLASVLNIIDAHVVVLGGGLSNIDALYAATEERLPGYLFSDMVRTRICKNTHGDSSGVRGAAWLWPSGGEPP